MPEERLPFQATVGAATYDHILRLPVTVLLENVRSLYNVGSFFRCADGVRLEKLVVSGYTGQPPHKGIRKTALGAEESVVWEYIPDAVTAAESLRHRGFELALVETSMRAVDLFDWIPRFPVCVVFGNEVEGVSPELAAICDTHVRIPMLGVKHSLNVATAGGIVVYELLRKYRTIGRR